MWVTFNSKFSEGIIFQINRNRKFLYFVMYCATVKQGKTEFKSIKHQEIFHRKYLYFDYFTVSANKSHHKICYLICG